MPDSKVDILIDIRERLQGLDKTILGLKRAQKQATGLGQALKAGLGIDLASRGVSGIQRLTGSIFGFIRAGLEFNATVEQQTIAFETLLGSAEEARKRIKSLTDFAASTPFQLNNLIAADRTLQVLTGGALNAADGLELVGDASAATNADINELAFWVGRLYAAIQSGQPVGEASLRLLELGVITGETRAQIDQASTAGEKWAVVLDRLNGFTGAMAKQAESANGQISTLLDTFKQTAGELTLDLFGLAKESLRAFLEELGALPTEVETAEKEILRIPQSIRSRLESVSSVFDVATLRLDIRRAIEETQTGIAALEAERDKLSQASPLGMSLSDGILTGAGGAGRRDENKQRLEEINQLLETQALRLATLQRFQNEAESTGIFERMEGNQSAGFLAETQAAANRQLQDALEKREKLTQEVAEARKEAQFENSTLQGKIDLIKQEIDAIEQRRQKKLQEIASTGALVPGLDPVEDVVNAEAELETIELMQRLLELEKQRTLEVQRREQALKSIFGVQSQEQVLMDALGTTVSGFSEAIAGAVVSGQDFGQVMLGVLRQVITQLIAATIRAIILKAILAAVGGGGGGGGFLGGLFGAKGGTVPGIAGDNFSPGGAIPAAEGGRVVGPGGPTEDRVGPFFLSPGEEIISARRAAKHRTLLDAIQKDAPLPLPAPRAGGLEAGSGAPFAQTVLAQAAAPSVNVTAQPPSVNIFMEGMQQFILDTLKSNKARNLLFDINRGQQTDLGHLG